MSSNAVVLAGTRGVLGALWAGLAIGVVQSVGSDVFGGAYRDLVVFVAFLLILTVPPSIATLRRRLPQRTATPVAVPEGAA